VCKIEFIALPAFWPIIHDFSVCGDMEFRPAQRVSQASIEISMHRGATRVAATFDAVHLPFRVISRLLTG
jgi:hypothetical protein